MNSKQRGLLFHFAAKLKDAVKNKASESIALIPLSRSREIRQNDELMAYDPEPMSGSGPPSPNPILISSI